MQIINQTSNNVELQELWTPILQLGDQLTTALVRSFVHVRNRSSSKFFQKCLNEDFRSTDQPFARRNSEVPSTITDLDETLKASANDLPEDDEESNSVLIAESDVEEEIEQFNGNPSTEAQTVNLDEEEVYDNLRSNASEA